MNISALSSLTPLSINTTNITDASSVIPTLITTANTTTEGYYGLGIMIVMFIALVFFLFRDDGDIRMDITRTLQNASGLVSIIGIIMLVSGFVTSFVHVMWFIAIFILTTIAVLLQKQKGY